MNIIEAIEERKSIRAYKPDPVPQETLTKVLEAAVRAPSWSNTQPWELVVVGGQPLTEIKNVLYKRVLEDAPRNADLPNPTFPALYQQRSYNSGKLRYESMGISRDNEEDRKRQRLRGAHFFGAPHGIFVLMDRQLGTWSILDLGLMMHNLVIAAWGHGLGTCIAVELVSQPDILRGVLGIPESKLIVVGTPIGYPDWDHPANKFRTPREPAENLTTWHGF